MSGNEQQRQYAPAPPYGSYPAQTSRSLSQRNFDPGDHATGGPSNYPQTSPQHRVVAYPPGVDPQHAAYSTPGRPGQPQGFDNGDLAASGNPYWQQSSTGRTESQQSGSSGRDGVNRSQKQTHAPSQFILPPGPGPPIDTWSSRYPYDQHYYARQASGSGSATSGMAPIGTYPPTSSSMPSIPRLPPTDQGQWGYPINYSIPSGSGQQIGLPTSSDVGDEGLPHPYPLGSLQDQSSSGSPASPPGAFSATGQPISPQAGDDLDESSLPIGSRDRRRAQNKIAQRAFRERAKLQAQEDKDHLAELEALTANQAAEIRQMAAYIENLRRENEALRAGTQNQNQDSGSSAVVGTASWNDVVYQSRQGAGETERDGIVYQLNLPRREDAA